MLLGRQRRLGRPDGVARVLHVTVDHPGMGRCRVPPILGGDRPPKITVVDLTPKIKLPVVLEPLWAPGDFVFCDNCPSTRAWPHSSQRSRETMSRTLNTSSRSAGQTAASSRPVHTPAATPHDTTRSTVLKMNGSLSHLKATRMKQPVQSRNLLPEPLTPVATVRRGGVQTCLGPQLSCANPSPHPDAALTDSNAGAKQVRATKTRQTNLPKTVGLS
ncbi:hypothetical protein PCASD_07586 [Puccinia coronata f. sp. avenae]|uniref:Uncharacterized protein n=2 Tax=Puccinia coronata f. sp. avenae TaxID=200324 RepID=A0A2N5TH08_9BASI|nr:hypothetical protein PCASD_07586 [Puccinia coronata f. sp. avenae]